MCAELDEECGPSCDSYGHADDCGAISHIAMMRNMKAQLAAKDARIAEAERLLRDVYPAQDDGNDEVEWLNRRDAWLAGHADGGGNGG
jgi:hypothetical protein